MCRRSFVLLLAIQRRRSFVLLLAIQIVEECYNITSEEFSWIAPEFLGEWRSEARAQGWSEREAAAFEHRFMFIEENGGESVNDDWFTAVQASDAVLAYLYTGAAAARCDASATQACIARGDLALLLLQVIRLQHLAFNFRPSCS